MKSDDYVINMKTRNSSKISPSSSKDRQQNSRPERNPKCNLKLRRRTKCTRKQTISPHCSSRQRRRSSSEEFPFQTLPTECQIKIFSFLSDSDKCRCAGLCRSWAQLMRTPRLWTNANFKHLFLSLQSNGEQDLAKPSAGEYRRMKTKIRNYVYHLVSRKAFLKSLTFAFDLQEGDEIWLKLLIHCLHETNSRELDSVTFNWIHTPYPYMFSDSASHTKSSRVLVFNKFMTALHHACPNVSSIAMPFDWSPLSLHLLSQFQNITSLELCKYWVFRGTSQSAIDKLLNHFPNLTRLKMDVAVKNRQFESYPVYTIRSQSLQELDIRDSNGFFLWSVNLPQLRLFHASRGSWCGPMIDRDHLRIPCLYTVLQNGTPNLQRFNDFALDDDWRLVCGPELERAFKASCFCKQHKRGALIY